MTRLLAFGDVHLGAGGSLGRAPGDRLLDQERVLEQIVALGGLRQVDAFLMCGDLFEGPTITPAQLEAFIRPFEQLQGEIPVVAISGNGSHDLARQPVDALQPLRHVPGVHVYTRPGVHRIPMSVDEDLAVVCLPWVSPARLVARSDAVWNLDETRDRDDVNARTAKLMVSIAGGLHETEAAATLLMLHGSISGASLPTGISTDELREPVLPLEELLDLGFHAIVGAHIHVPQFVTADGYWEDAALHATSPQPGLEIVYTGSPMPLNFGETGVPHGVWILDVDHEGARAEFAPLESRRLVQSHLDLAALETEGIDPVVEFDGILDANAWPDVDDAIVKVVLHATRSQQRRLELGRLREAVLAAGAHTVKIELDTVREERSRVAGVTEDLEPLAAFDAWAAVNGTGVHPDDIVRAREQMEADLEAVGT